ncbi:MAG: metallophosphoesterase [Bacteroidota bacterium]
MVIRLLLILVFLAIIDIYAFRGIHHLLPRGSRPGRIATRLYWLVDGILVLFILAWLYFIRNTEIPDYVTYRRFFYIAGGVMLVFLPKVVFMLFVALNDLKSLLVRVFQSAPAGISRTGKTPQLPVGSRIILIAGLFMSLTAFGVILHGMTLGRYHFRVEHETIVFDHLPAAFDGYRIIHFSDTHLGSYPGTGAVNKGVGMINDLDGDIILFTGDLINNRPAEARHFIPIFERLNAPDGLYAVLGNHDLGDYRRWSTIEKKSVNMDALTKLYNDMGFTLLRNEHRFIQREGDSLLVAGVDNWGLPPFSQYGDLSLALKSGEEAPFQILLTHDPSHWRAEVIPDTDIDLTLSGHTHGMQFGISTRRFQWSPAAWVYPEWNGLYHEGEQKIYVNRGFGFLSFPGRIGMSPEITVLTLRKPN